MPSFHNPFLKNLVRFVCLAKSADRLKIPLDVLASLERTKDDPITRREILKLGLLGAVWVPTSQLQQIQEYSRQKLALKKTQNLSPVIVLGGGVAGLVTAYRLNQAGIPVQIFEGSSRWGGRIFTQQKFNSDHMFWERGGELIDSNHTDLLELAAELGLIVEDTTLSDKNFKPLVYLYKNKALSDSQVSSGLSQLARALAPDLEKINALGPQWRPTQVDASNPLVANLDRLSIADYLRTKELDPWVVELLSALYVSEFGLEVAQQSALNLLTLITLDHNLPKLLGESDESKRIRGGNEQLPQHLLKKLSAQIPMHLDHELVRISPSSSTALKLTFIKDGGSAIEVLAEKVVCTLPFTKLRAVTGLFDLDLRPEKKVSIRTLGFGTCSKIGLGFKSRPWRAAPHLSTGTLLDDQHQYLWETSRLQKGEKGILTNLIGGAAGAQIKTGKVDDLLKMLNLAYPGSKSLMENDQVLVQHWPSNRWSLGSYTCHLPGQYTTIRGVAGEPELKGRLHFAGEHTSLEFEGFMNGAIETANRVARKIRNEVIRPFPSVARAEFLGRSQAI